MPLDGNLFCRVICHWIERISSGAIQSGQRRIMQKLFPKVLQVLPHRFKVFIPGGSLQDFVGIFCNMSEEQSKENLMKRTELLLREVVSHLDSQK